MKLSDPQRDDVVDHRLRLDGDDSDTPRPCLLCGRPGWDQGPCLWKRTVGQVGDNGWEPVTLTCPRRQQ